MMKDPRSPSVPRSPIVKEYAKKRWKAVTGVAVREDANPQWRPTMEDAHVAIDEFAKNPTCAFFGVYDGHGGSDAAECVSQHLHGYLEEAMAQNPRKDFKTHATLAYAQMDDKLMADGIYYQGTTSVTVMVKQEGPTRKVYCANVGDARAVLGRGTKAIRLSYDHKAGDPAETERVQAAGGWVALNRVSGVLAISRALGDHTMKKLVISEPYCSVETICPDDRWLVIACDGLWDVVSDEEAIAAIKDCPDAASAAEKLHRIAMEDTRDNLTLYVVEL